MTARLSFGKLESCCEAGSPERRLADERILVRPSQPGLPQSLTAQGRHCVLHDPVKFSAAGRPAHALTRFHGSPCRQSPQKWRSLRRHSHLAAGLRTPRAARYSGPEPIGCAETMNDDESRGCTWQATDLPRRQALRRLTAAGAVVALGKWAPPLAAPADTPRVGGRIRVASVASSLIDTLDPARGALSTDY